jgi:hypothetical protein
MNHHDILDQINDHADGTLSPDEHEHVERHLAECEACRHEADAVRALLSEARALPRGITPSRDLWSGIAARIDATGAATPTGAPEAPASGGSTVIQVDFRPAARRSPWVMRGLLAAAAVVLITLSSAITASLMRSPAGGPLARGSTEAVGAPAQPAVVAALAAFQPAEREYIQTADELSAVLEARREILAPETVRIIEDNLQIIDQAIAEARAALEADPNNRELTQMLSGVYRKKVELLQDAVLLQVKT